MPDGVREFWADIDSEGTDSLGTETCSKTSWGDEDSRSEGKVVATDLDGAKEAKELELGEGAVVEVEDAKGVEIKMGG